MKNLMKLAMGAAIAGALVNMLMKKQRSRRDMEFDRAWPEDDWSETNWRGSAMPEDADSVTAVEIIADESSVGEGSGDDRVLLPDDGRVRGPLNS
jgi:hypothetical protein